MSHFIINSSRVFIFGTPKGHANTQLLQAMQRGFRAVCTTPSSVRLIASAGHTSAQVGESQCMHTTGIVCGDSRRFINSRWIIECPLCVSHSLHAEKGREYLWRQRPDLATRLVRGRDYRLGEWVLVKPALAVLGLRNLRRIAAGNR